jgi:hypothetical protein
MNNFSLVSVCLSAFSQSLDLCSRISEWDWIGIRGKSVSMREIVEVTVGFVKISRGFGQVLALSVCYLRHK